MSSLRPVVRFVGSVAGKSNAPTPPRKTASSSLPPVMGYVELACIVKPNARGRSDSITAVSPEGIELCVSSPAKDGKANEDVKALVAKVLSVAKSDVVISKGATSHYKVLTIHNISLNMGSDRNTGKAKTAPEHPVNVIQSDLQWKTVLEDHVLHILKKATESAD